MLSPRLLDLLSLLGYHAANSPGLLIRLARVLAYVTDYHMHVLGRRAGTAPRTALARGEHQKVVWLRSAWFEFMTSVPLSHSSISCHQPSQRDLPSHPRVFPTGNATQVRCPTELQKWTVLASESM